MPSIEITDDQHDRITTLREEIAASHASSYTSVTVPDTVAYLLDLADTVEDPDRQADSEALLSAATTNNTEPVTETEDTHSFPREQIKTRLQERNRQDTDSNSDEPMDLYSIAAAYDISGRSNMTKAELVTAILDVIERRYTDPLAPIDIDFPDPNSSVDATSADTTTESNTANTDASTTDSPDDSGDDGQLNAMLNLLDTHSDKWQSADGDTRYEVELPDGSVESARTKDDVRATLFKHY